MNKLSTFSLSAIIGLALSGAALAQSAGTIAEVKDGGRQIVLKTSDGKMESYSVSGSRTKVTVSGKEGREGLKAGLTCSVTGAAGAEATAITCK